MLLSRCHKVNVHVLTDYYVCEKCGKSCDTVSNPTWMRDRHDDTRYEDKVATLFG